MAQAETSTEEAQQRWRYRRLFLAEAVLLAETVGACVLIPETKGGWAQEMVFSLFVALMYWHVVVIPICFCYLVGKPVVISLSPLIPSAQCRAFWRLLRERSILDDDEFHARYYKGARIPKQTPARVRKALQTIEPMLERAIPTDPVWVVDDELDFIWVLNALEKEFGIRFTKGDPGRIDGTLGNLVLLIHERISSPFE